MTDTRYQEVYRGMLAADDDPLTLVAHARMHQLVARKPVPSRRSSQLPERLSVRGS